MKKLAILWIVLTIGCESAANEDYEKLMRAGEPAPYAGVLVPPDAYRFYQIDSLSLEKCKVRLEAGAVACPACEEWFSSKQLAFLIGGLALGFVAANSAR